VQCAMRRTAFECPDATFRLGPGLWEYPKALGTLGLRVMVDGFGFRVCVKGFGLWGQMLGFRVKGLRFRAYGLGFQGLRFKVLG